MSQTRWLFVGALCFVFVGCAASSGGGHVVGNPLVSERESKPATKSCGCAHHGQGDKDHAGCGCAKGAVSGEGSCGGDSGCGCGHKE